MHFNTSYVTVQRHKPSHPSCLFNISIHPMLRFNGLITLIIDKYIEFQYILCYGSTFWLLELELSYPNFNTSYVTVQH